MIRLSLVLLAVFCLSAQGLAGAELDDPQQAVEAGREALDQWWGYPWYDSESDSLRRVELPVTPQTSSRQWNSWFDWANAIRFFGWAALAAILATIAWLLIRAYLDRETRAARESSRQAARRSPAEADRVTALPFQVRRPESDLLGEARRHYERGEYSEAIIYLYSHQLVELDKAQLIHLARGKTNRQYLREARASCGAGDVLQATMTLFEKSFFGHHPIRREQFESCWNRLSEFEQYLTPVAV